MPPELSPPTADPSPAPFHADDVERADRLAGLAAVAEAMEFLERDDARTLADQRELTSIPAPPFAETARARTMAVRLGEAGLEVEGEDAVGNVVARYPDSGSPADPGRLPLIVSAHLDTVFPAETEIVVREDGDRLVGPGISDDGRGLAALLALARALRAGGIHLRHPLLVVATVGEEGAGDLRGVRHLFSGTGAAGAGCAAFVSLDGAGVQRIVNTGLGSRRWHVQVTGPGGHSWGDHGVPNPIHALGRAVATLSRRELPPRTTFSAGRQGGGTSVNAIPTSAWVEMELRSTDPSTLEALDGELLGCVRRRVAEVSDAGSGARLEVAFTPMGRRPAGSTAPGAAIVRAAAAATRALGFEPALGASSTDANLPMSLGIPAVTLGAGGEAGQAHTPREWYRNVHGPRGIARALLTLLLADGQG